MSDLTSLKRNSAKIKSLSDFYNYRGSENIFVRILGENNTFLSDFNCMESNICQEMSRGRAVYKRVSVLPKLVSVDDVNYYTECYNEFLRSFKKKAIVKATTNNDRMSQLLANALTESLNLMRKTNSHLTPAMEKNFAVKQLFWFDSVAVDLTAKGGFNGCVKVVGENIVKVQEYLFFYLMALVGFDVLLIQNKCDIDNEAKKLDLTSSCVLGHLGTTSLPEYKESGVSGYNNPGNTNNNSVVRSDSQQSNSGNIRVTIPPRPGRQSTTSQSVASQQSGNIRVTIPPRQGRQSTSSQTMPNQQSGNVRVTIPPRQGRQSTPSQAMPNQPQSGNVRITMPPRPGSQNRPNTQGGTFPINSTPPQQSRGMRITTPTRPNPSISIPQNRVPSSSQPRVEKSYEELAQLASSIVLIYILKKKPFGKEDGEVVGTGSGIMIGENGYILTNCHVARAGTAYGIRLENDENIYFTDELIKYHADLDLAIIRIDKRLRPLKIYKGSQGLVRGQRVVAIGSPLGLFNTVSDGIISGFRNVDGTDMIQFTAPISHGSSGGAVLNMYGEVIGISTAGIDDGQNINLAVSYEAINNFIGNFL